MAMQDEIDRLAAEVNRTVTVSQSAITLLGQLADMIRNAADDPEQVRALADTVQANADSLAAAIEANTPPPA